MTGDGMLALGCVLVALAGLNVLLHGLLLWALLRICRELDQQRQSPAGSNPAAGGVQPRRRRTMWD